MAFENIRSALLKICEQESLRFVEAELADDEVVCLRFEDKVVFNTGAKEIG